MKAFTIKKDELHPAAFVCNGYYLNNVHILYSHVFLLPASTNHHICLADLLVAGGSVVLVANRG